MNKLSNCVGKVSLSLFALVQKQVHFEQKI